MSFNDSAVSTSSSSSTLHLAYTIELILANIASLFLLFTLLSQLLVYRFTPRKRWSKAKGQLLACSTIGIVFIIPRNIDPSNVFNIIPFPTTHALSLQVTAILVHCGALVLLGSLRSLSLLIHAQIPLRISKSLILSTSLYNLLTISVSIYVGAVYSPDMQKEKMFRVLLIRNISFVTTVIFWMVVSWYSLGRLRYLTQMHMEQLQQQEVRTNERIRDAMRSSPVVCAKPSLVQRQEQEKKQQVDSISSRALTNVEEVHRVSISQEHGLPLHMMLPPPPPQTTTSRQASFLNVKSAAINAAVSSTIVSSHPPPLQPPVSEQKIINVHVITPHTSFLTTPSFLSPPSSTRLTPPARQLTNINSASLRIAELSAASSKLGRFVFISTVVVLIGVLPIFLAHGNYSVEDFIAHDTSAYPIGRAVTPLMQYLGLCVALWFAWVSPRKWIYSNLPFWKTLLHGVPVMNDITMTTACPHRIASSRNLTHNNNEVTTLHPHPHPFPFHPSYVNKKRVADLSCLVPLPNIHEILPASPTFSPTFLPAPGMTTPSEIISSDSAVVAISTITPMTIKTSDDVISFQLPKSSP